MKKLAAVIFTAFICSMSCKNLVDKVIQEQGVKVYQGYNKNGKLASCVTTKATGQQACTEIFGPDEQFAENCKKSGGEVATCGCHNYLCSQKIGGEDATPEPDPTEGLVLYKGYNSEGVKTQCSVDPKANLVCDMSFQPGDQYGADCRAKGYTAYQCGCHTYLCSESLKRPVIPHPEPKKTYTGYNKEGVQKSCSVDLSKPMMCTTVFGPGDQFAADCRAKGHDAYQCGCHDYLCSKPLVGPSEDPITYRGFNMDGEQTSCTVTPGLTVMCLVAHPSAERYRQECQTQGGQAFACYCQNFLCSKKIPFTK